MQQAIKCANRAAEIEEVPVGAVVVLDDKIIGQGWNQPISTHNPTAHAEIMALQQAAHSQKNYRLLDSTLYVTLEPCCMCVGAIIHARVQRLVFGAYDKKTGAVESQLGLLSESFHNHKVKALGGVLQAQCAEILTNFFSHLRSMRKGS
ncbi:tRNA-specific adenosine-34 deaminase [hydrothermal vent metagenome]|uniref:tRNA-specific adenosine deaminase 2 n=1 Tax=hydrothermal vent metagenome TaxID=652676 RepID=A0A3B0YPI4_9ZZZZ